MASPSSSISLYVLLLSVVGVGIVNTAALPNSIDRRQVPTTASTVPSTQASGLNSTDTALDSDFSDLLSKWFQELDQNDTVADTGCFLALGRLFHTVGHPLQSIRIDMTHSSLKEACDILRMAGAKVAPSAASPSAGDNPSDHGPSLGSPAGITVKEPNEDIVSRIKNLVTGQRQKQGTAGTSPITG